MSASWQPPIHFCSSTLKLGTRLAQQHFDIWSHTSEFPRVGSTTAAARTPATYFVFFLFPSRVPTSPSNSNSNSCLRPPTAEHSAVRTRTQSFEEGCAKVAMAQKTRFFESAGTALYVVRQRSKPS